MNKTLRAGCAGAVSLALLAVGVAQAQQSEPAVGVMTTFAPIVKPANIQIGVVWTVTFA